MTLPKDITLLLAPPDRPTPADWSQGFAKYQWFRLVGFPGRLNNPVKGLRTKFHGRETPWPIAHDEGKKILLNKEILLSAASRVPSEWKKHPDFAHLDWKTPLSDLQMRAAINRKALLFDRACLVLGVIDILFEQTGHRDKAIQDYVRIAPAMFYIDEFTPEFFEANFTNTTENRQRLDKLGSLTANSNPKFFKDLSQIKRTKVGRPAHQHGATKYTLEKVVDALRAMPGIKFQGQVAYHSERGHRHPSDAENPVFPGD